MDSEEHDARMGKNGFRILSFSSNTFVLAGVLLGTGPRCSFGERAVWIKRKLKVSEVFAFFGPSVNWCKDWNETSPEKIPSKCASLSLNK